MTLSVFENLLCHHVTFKIYRLLSNQILFYYHLTVLWFVKGLENMCLIKNVLFWVSFCQHEPHREQVIATVSMRFWWSNIGVLKSTHCSCCIVFTTVVERFGYCWASQISGIGGANFTYCDKMSLITTVKRNYSYLLYSRILGVFGRICEMRFYKKIN